MSWMSIIKSVAQVGMPILAELVSKGKGEGRVTDARTHLGPLLLQKDLVKKDLAILNDQGEGPVSVCFSRNTENGGTESVVTELAASGENQGYWAGDDMNLFQDGVLAITPAVQGLRDHTIPISRVLTAAVPIVVGLANFFNNKVTFEVRGDAAVLLSKPEFQSASVTFTDKNGGTCTLDATRRSSSTPGVTSEGLFQFPKGISPELPLRDFTLTMILSPDSYHEVVSARSRVEWVTRKSLG